MKLPAWASADHPIVHRELNIWRRTFKRWGWVALPVLILPCACSGLCSLSGLPIALEADNFLTGLVIFLVWAALIGFWVTSGLFGWITSTFASVSCATAIARERETSNWAMLRITSLSIPEIIYAKTMAVLRLLLWPTLFILTFDAIAGGLFALGALGVIALLGTDPTSGITLEMQLGLAAYTLLGIVPLALYFISASLINLLYNCAIGLLTSSYSRTSGSAVALSFAVHFGVSFFVFVPLQQVVSIGVQLLGGLAALITQSPVLFIVFTLLTSIILPLFLQAVIGAAAFYVAIAQSQKIIE